MAKSRRKQKTAEVVVLPGIERRDLGFDCPAESVLQEALKNGVQEVIIVGKDRSGQPYIAGTQGDVDRAVGRLMWAVSFLTTSQISHD